ncbi:MULTISPECIES: hypothetical protein [Caballeronia]|uniref:hypothetical protein n=2 Tax=Burkholderiaceae TaxID=119060 RepID=UPI00025BC91D|nr:MULTISPECIES: hypothetical protein [Caballeronia]EKS67566.1 hypothetical protein BURK_021070 [Burkholderia sp. SJ98]
METRDHLVRLSMGAVPDDIDVSDWMLLTGDVLYLLARCSGEVSYLRVPLDLELLNNVRKSTMRKGDGVYRNSRGEPTLLATYLAFVFLQRDVPIQAIRRELGLSEAMMNLLLVVWHFAVGVIDCGSRLQLIPPLPFEGNGDA